MAKILLVEDDKSLREIYGVRLLAEGYDIVSAGDGEEALAMAIKERPDLIVSDVMMPKISGFDMLDILRSTTETKAIKVIMMTALSSEDQRQRGEQLGADRYLVKSQVGIEDVVRTVHEVLADAPMSNGAGASTAPVAKPAPASAATVPSRSPAPAVPSRAAPVEPPAAAAPQPQAPVQPNTPAASSLPTPSDNTPAVAPDPSPAGPVSVSTNSSVEPPASTLPQPTAPFSTQRPAGLADRIIQPLERPEEESEPLGNLMDRELGAPAESPAPIAPPSPPTPPMPQPPEQPQPSQSIPPAPSTPPEDHGISFEETPRPPA